MALEVPLSLAVWATSRPFREATILVPEKSSGPVGAYMMPTHECVLPFSLMTACPELQLVWFLLEKSSNPSESHAENVKLLPLKRMSPLLVTKVAPEAL